MGWEAKLSDTYWENAIDMTWNVDHWDFDGVMEGWMFAKAAWAADYRPTKLRVAHSGGGTTLYIKLEDGNDNTIGIDTSAESGDEIDLTFNGGDSPDIDQIYFSEADISDYDIDNIEFYVVTGPEGVDEILDVDMAGGDADEFLTISYDFIDELMTVA